MTYLANSYLGFPYKFTSIPWDPGEYLGYEDRFIEFTVWVNPRLYNNNWLQLRARS